MANKKFPLKFIEIIMLLAIWLVLIAAPVLFRQDEEINWQQLANSMEVIVPLFIIFLINRLLFVPKLLFQDKRILYMVSVAGLISVLTVGSYFLTRDQIQPGPNQRAMEQGMNPPPPHFKPPDGKGLGPTPQNRRGGPIPPFANFLIFSVLLVGFDTGIRVSFRLVETERAKARLEKEKTGAQLAFLRNQVSPHFFMNTLNNIHSLIDHDSDEAKESIIRLSKLMRHLLYESEVEKIPIQKEIDFIKNYVDLMKLRYSDRVKINLRIPAKLPDKSIPPLLFTSYVENAFKHGISYQNSSFIDIKFTIDNNNLIFMVHNSKPHLEINEEPSGIGIENSQKRLDLIYGDNYKLEIDDKKDEYHVLLSLPL